MPRISQIGIVTACKPVLEESNPQAVVTSVTELPLHRRLGYPVSQVIPPSRRCIDEVSAMSGRNSPSLLALSLFALIPCFAAGQTELRRPEPLTTPRVANAPARYPHPIRPPVTEPLPTIPGYPVRTPDVTGLSQLVHAAGMIFSGTVIRIERHPPANRPSVETVAITFQVENSIRGATPGHRLTISEWSGLWSSGQRYRVGQRVLLFFYPRSKLGLTSVVAGPMGRFDVDQSGYVLLSSRHLSALQFDPVLGGKSRVRFRDFASAVRRAGEEE